MWSYLLAMACGFLLGVFIVGAVYLGYSWWMRATDGGSDLPPGSVGSEAVTAFVPAAEDDLASLVDHVDLSDPAVRMGLALHCLRLYSAQGGDPRLLSLLPDHEEDDEIFHEWALRRRNGD